MMIHTHLPFFAVVRVSGDDRHNFLHNQLSNDINTLPVQHACYATYNTPKGRVIANMLVYNQGDALLLALAADLAASVVKRLQMFVLRAKVQLAILPDWGVSGCLKNGAAAVYADTPVHAFTADQGAAQLPHGGVLTFQPTAALPAYNAAAEQAWNTHEIACGYPWIAAATSETCVAQMLNQHTIGAVHFRKGCYPGQEIIARAQYRGQVKRGLAVLESTAPLAAGAALHDENGGEVGLVINAAGCLNLAVIKYAAANAAICDVSGAALTLQTRFFAADGGEA